MEQTNLDTLKSEIETHLKENDFLVFHGFSRALERKVEVEWDTARYPDYKEFLAVAKHLGIKLIVLHHREFSASLVERALEELEESTIDFEDQREVERRLHELRVYDGFTCAVEMSFDYENVSYFFEMRTQWYTELNNILDELDILGDEEDDDEDPLSGYYSKN